MGLAIIVSNGCQLDSNQCTAMKELLVDIVERTHNDERVKTLIVPHEMGNGHSIIGNRDELLDGIDELTCSTDSNSVNFNGALLDTNLILTELGEYKKIIMISFCLDPELTQTCNTGGLISKDIEITVLNAGSFATQTDQFECLLNEIRVNENYFEINEISVSSLLRKADELQDRICKKHTFSPTALPTPQPSLYPTTSIDKERCEIIGELECTSDALNNDGNSICADYEAGDCAVYYENVGCNECTNNTFRLNDDYPCVNCREYTGSGCLYCDIGGCEECDDGFELIESNICGLKYCQRKNCYPYILLPYNSDIDQWQMVGDDNTHYSYSGSYSWDENNLYFIRHSGDYIILIEQLFKDSDSDADNTDWYLVIKSIYDSNYDTAIYYKYPTGEWGSDNKDPTNTVADTSSSNEWLCVPKAEYSQCKVYTQIFELFDGCTGSSNVFCNATGSNFPSYIDCTGSESIASSDGARFGRRAGVVYGGALIAMFITFVIC